MRFSSRMLLTALFLAPVAVGARTPVDAQIPSADQQQVGINEPVGDMPRMPFFAIKTNLLYDATTTFNLGAEFRLSKSLSLDIPVNYNPWTFSHNRKIKHVLVQPELRYWIHEPFNGHFLGVNLMWATYNEGGIGLPVGLQSALGFGDWKHNRYEGNAYSVGISYGYHWILSNHFSFEATLGVGYVYLDYDKFKCEKCGEKLGHETKNYFGPTKLGFSLVYIIK